MSEVTQLLAAINNGDAQATARLLPLVYEELRRLARSRMVGERAGHTLQATALIHEAYLRLLGEEVRWEGRGHFFAAAAEAMRRILIEHARARQTLKRGGKFQRVELDDFPPIALPCKDFDDLLELDAALQRLAQEAPGKAELVKLLYFAGLSLDEAATVQGISRTTAYRHWQFARAWLFDALADHSKAR